MVHGFVKQSGGHIKIFSEVGRDQIVKGAAQGFLPLFAASFSQPTCLPTSLDGAALSVRLP
jgi:hypothetical protein